MLSEARQTSVKYLGIGNNLSSILNEAEDSICLFTCSVAVHVLCTEIYQW